MTDKNDLRKNAKYIRETLSISEKSELAVAQIRKHSFYKNATNILIYYPLKFELNLLALLDDKKNFFLPRVCGQNLQICPFKKGDKLEKSRFNVCEPCSTPITPEQIDLAIVPALMADSFGYRLGYGGGFYDRFLTKNSNIKTILPIAKELFVEKLPHECFDIPVNDVIII